MRVTVVNKYYFPHLGGIEKHIHDLGTALAARPGTEVRAIVANECRSTEVDDVEGVEVTRLKRAFAYASTPVAFGMAAAIRAEQTRPDPADVLHLQFPYPWGDFSWQRANVSTPTVLTYHSDIVRQRALLASYTPLLLRTLDRVDAIITGSPQMVEYSPFLHRYAAKVRVVPFGIRVERFKATALAQARAAELLEGRERPVVLFVGRLIYYKGVDVLVQAMRDVDADLVIIGRGPLESRLRASAEALGVARRLTILPPQPDAELAAWYQAARVLCLPSVARSEAYGLVQLEAHASGTPVVSTDLPTGVPFVNEDGVTGLIVPPGDPRALAEALRGLVEDEKLARRLGRQAKTRALRDFAIERMVRDTVRVYEGLTSRGRD